MKQCRFLGCKNVIEDWKFPEYCQIHQTQSDSSDDDTFYIPFSPSSFGGGDTGGGDFSGGGGGFDGGGASGNW